MKTIEEKLEVMRGWLEGKPIQYYSTVGQWIDIANPPWRWDVVDYRIKPEPVPKRRVPLEPEDLPAVCWLKQPGNRLIRLAVGVSSNKVRVVCNCGTEDVTFDTLMWLNWEYSEDRKIWHPMWKEVE